ncbi:MAG: hypothetical protein VYE64_09845 [Planctomycetota bacterium]|nr:hypothetical protein [Planctomycetota bacterium]
MNRRSRSTRDSLDLLLDTVCNAFGGIVFISILIVVLLNLTSTQRRVTPPTPKAQAELMLLQSAAHLKQEQLQVLRNSVKQIDSIDEQFVDPDANSLASQLEELVSDHHALEAEQAEVTLAIASGQTEINKIATALSVLDRKLNDTRSDISDAQRRLDAEIAARSRTSSLPKQRTTDKRLVGFLLKKGRLCSIYRVDRAGQLVLNDLECQIHDLGNGSRSITARPGAGLEIASGNGKQPAVTGRFSQFDNTRDFLAVVVWPDSFSLFETVKRAIVAEKFEYQLIPWPTGDRLLLGSSKGPQRVQ